MRMKRIEELNGVRTLKHIPDKVAIIPERDRVSGWILTGYNKTPEDLEKLKHEIERCYTSHIEFHVSEHDLTDIWCICYRSDYAQIIGFIKGYMFANDDI